MFVWIQWMRVMDVAVVAGILTVGGTERDFSHLGLPTVLSPVGNWSVLERESLVCLAEQKPEEPPTEPANQVLPGEAPGRLDKSPAEGNPPAPKGEQPPAPEQPKSPAEKPTSPAEKPKSPTEQPNSPTEHPKSPAEQPTPEQPQSPADQSPTATEPPKSPIEKFSTPAPEKKPPAGQADLDKATELRFKAKKLSDLEEVIRLCRSALEKGLDEAGTEYAKTMLASTLIQRGVAVAKALLETPFIPRLEPFRQSALNDLETAVAILPNQAEALVFIARLHLLPGGDTKRAAKALDDALAVPDAEAPTRAMAFRLRASLQQDPQKQLADLNEALRLQPENPETLRERGVAYVELGQWDKALADFDAALKLDPKHIPTYIAKALVLSKQEKYDAALAVLAEARKIDPKSAELWVQQARVHVLQKNFPEAIKDLDEALKEAAEPLVVRLLRAEVFQEMEQFDKALAEIDEVLKQEPDLRLAVRYRAVLLAELKRTEEAVELMEDWMRRHPDDEEGQLQLASLYLADNRPRRAIELFTEILRKNPDNPAALRGRGDAYLNIGKHAEAIADYERALKLRPNDSGLLNNFAWVLATSPVDSLRNGKRALEMALKACELTQYKEAHILSTLGAAYAELGDFETAKKWSAKAIELGRANQKDQLRKELESYQQQKPFRELIQTEEKQPKPKPKLPGLPKEQPNAQPEEKPEEKPQGKPASP
jgi:tetratricopeptide (TPR) repeat protein